MTHRVLLGLIRSKTISHTIGPLNIAEKFLRFKSTEDIGDNNNMRIFLTGATGFIGSHLARLLVHEGCEVHTLTRERSTPWRISDIIQLLHVVPCDLLSFDKLDAHLKEIQPEICLHLA